MFDCIPDGVCKKLKIYTDINSLLSYKKNESTVAFALLTISIMVCCKLNLTIGDFGAVDFYGPHEIGRFGKEKNREASAL